MAEHSLDQEIVDHAFNPKNYGKVENPDGVGVGIDPSGVYLMFYLKFSGETLGEIGYATSGSQDAITLASILSEMTKGDTEAGIVTSLEGLEAEVEALYAEKLERLEAMRTAGSKAKVSFKEQDTASMVLAAMRAALINYHNRLAGSDEAQHQITIELRGGKDAKRGCSTDFIPPA
jgi:NifU-like protein involved in Fe-S cluster formation